MKYGIYKMKYGIYKMKYGIYNTRANIWCGDLDTFETSDINEAYKKLEDWTRKDGRLPHLTPFLEVKVKEK